MAILGMHGGESPKERFKRMEQPKIDVRRLADVVDAAAKGEKLSAAVIEAARLALMRLAARVL